MTATVKALCVTCLILIFAPVTQAEQRMFRELSDSELSDLRGKYRPSENLHIFFGLKMESQWRTAEGDIYHSGLSFSLGGSSPVPQTRFYAYQSKPHEAAQSAGETRGGLADVTGIAQSNQLAGVGNQAQNVARVHVSDNSADIDKFQASSVPRSNTPTQGIRLHQGDKSLGIAIQTPNGSARQGVFGSQLRQSISVTGDYQQVHQRLELIFVTGHQSVSRSLSVNDAVRNAIQLQ